MTAVAKPFVQIACVCEKVLHEKDGVASLIRVVDTYTMELPKDVPAGFTLATQLTAFVSLKSGDVIGQFPVGLRLNQPNGKALPTREMPVEFKGNESGANLQIEFALANPAVGLYWIDVLWGDEILTRIPFRLKTKASPQASTAEGAASGQRSQ